jgi:hypothetical protein
MVQGKTQEARSGHQSDSTENSRINKTLGGTYKLASSDKCNASDFPQAAAILHSHPERSLVSFSPRSIRALL